MTKQNETPSVVEKIGYGLGDTASNLIFQTVMLFLAFFYTDIFGISPAVVGTMFLVVRIFDGITDPLIGLIADRTNTRWGKFRPYLLWMSLPLALTSVLAFTTPDLSDSNKIIYAYVTYGLMMLAYTAINIPYCALGGVITGDQQQRVSVQSYRFALAMTGGLLVSSLTIPLVDYFGNGDKQLGYQLTILSMSILGIILFTISFATTKERVSPPAHQPNQFKKDFQALIKNDQWLIICMISFVVLVGMVVRGTVSIYYVTHYLHAESLVTIFITLGMIGAIAGSFLSQYLSKYFCKIKGYSYANIGAGILCILSFFIPSQSFVLALVIHILISIILQIGTPFLWSMMADVVDYGQWKTGVRITGLTYSSNLFFLKLGMAFGGAIAGWVLAGYGYQGGQEQTESATTGILLLFTLLPGAIFIALGFLIRLYKLDNEKLSLLQSELKLQ